MTVTRVLTDGQANLASGATAWFNLEEQDFKELMRLYRSYRREAVRSTDSKAYLAGCVMAAAALEAALLAMIHIHAREVEAAGLVPNIRRQPKPLLKWTLPEMLRAASGMDWLPSGLQLGGAWIARRAKIGDYAEALRQIRNLIHAARYVQDHSPSRVTKRYLEGSLAILEGATTHLEAKVNASLRKWIAQKDNAQ